MEIIRQAVEIFASFFDCIVIVYFLNRYFEMKYNNKLLISIFGIIPLFFIAYYLTDNFVLQLLLQVIVIYVYAFTFLKGEKLKKLFIDFAIIFIMAIINLSTIQFVSLITGISAAALVEPGSNQRIIALAISKLCLIFIAYILLHTVKENEKLKRDEWILIFVYFLSATIVSIVLLNIVVNVDMNVIKQMEMISVTFLLLIITGTSFILVGKISKEKEYESINRILNVQLEEQKLSLVKIQSLHDETQKLRHDISRHFSVFVSMLKNNQIEEVINKMEEYTQLKSEDIVIYIHNNNMINAVLNEKVEICNVNKISFELEISSVIEKEKELETAIMLSNLLDNAIEAEQKIMGERKIKLEIFRHKEMYNLIISNNIMESVLKNNKNLNTSKKDKKEHGIGLLNVKDTIKKFEGNFACYEKDNQFAIHIMVPN